MKLLTIVLLMVGAAGAQTAADPEAPRKTPNLVLIIADDCTWSDIEVYGGQAKTPNLARLARSGMTFSHCFQSAPMCSPTRHSLYTGLYPVKSGAWPNHTRAFDWVKSIAHHLQTTGYRTHLSGKTHIAPKKVFPFETSSRGNPNPRAMSAFIGDCRRESKPFLLIAASREPHWPWNKGDASAYPPGELSLPPVLADTPRTRRLFSSYLAEITFFDAQVGQVLALLDEHEVADETLVIVLSEQGNSFPFAKWTCYEAGLRSGLIARWPGRIKPGSKSDALVEYVDIVPTFLEAVGLERPEILDGRSFLSVLRGKRKKHKELVYGLQTSRGISDGPEHYGVRSVRGRRYRYIRNLTPETAFTNTMTAGKSGLWTSWATAASTGDTRAKKLMRTFQHRPGEELYDCESDPWNRNNLIAEEDVAPVAARLRGALDAWMKSQGDEGQATEMKARERQSRGRRKK